MLIFAVRVLARKTRQLDARFGTSLAKKEWMRWVAFLLSFAGGAITDWFSFSLGLSRQSFATGDLTFKGTSFLFRVETYPLFPRGGIFRDLGVGLDLGTGSGKVVREGLLRAAAGGGATSVFGGNVWYEALRLSTFTVGPAIGYHHFVAETLAVNTLTVGARVAFTSGP